MEIYLIVTILGVILMAVLGYFMGSRGKKAFIETIDKLESSVAEKQNIISDLKSERDVAKEKFDNVSQQLVGQKELHDRQVEQLKLFYELQLKQSKEAYDAQVVALKELNA